MPQLMFGDRSHQDFAIFEAWQKSANELYQDFEYAEADLDPFNFNEVACVSFLAAAAGRARFAPLMESNLIKASTSKAVAGEWKGRADLLLFAGGKRYIFEFKTCWRNPKECQISECLSLAEKDAASIPSDQNTFRYAAIITSFDGSEDFSRCEKYQDSIFSFAVMRSDDLSGAFFYFREVKATC
jgi:hypothetical protein